MKIRTDFVTNSSSSSFVAIQIKSEKFADLVDKYFEILEEHDVYFDFQDDSIVNIDIDEMFISEPYWVEGILDAFLDGLQYVKDIKEFANELDKNKKEVVDDIECFKFERSDSG